jgi:hypothetical protein
VTQAIDMLIQSTSYLNQFDDNCNAATTSWNWATKTLPTGGYVRRGASTRARLIAAGYRLGRARNVGLYGPCREGGRCALRP